MEVRSLSRESRAAGVFRVLTYSAMRREFANRARGGNVTSVTCSAPGESRKSLSTDVFNSHSRWECLENHAQREWLNCHP